MASGVLRYDKLLSEWDSFSITVCCIVPVGAMHFRHWMAPHGTGTTSFQHVEVKVYIDVSGFKHHLSILTWMVGYSIPADIYGDRSKGPCKESWLRRPFISCLYATRKFFSPVWVSRIYLRQLRESWISLIIHTIKFIQHRDILWRCILQGMAYSSNQETINLLWEGIPPCYLHVYG